MGEMRTRLGWAVWASGLLLLAGSHAVADTVIWVGGADLNWTTPGNWSTGNVPGPADDVVMNLSAYPAPVVNISSGLQSINSITDNGAPALNINGGSLAIASDSEIDSTLSLSSGGITNNANLTLTNLLTWTGGTIAGPGAIVTTGQSFQPKLVISTGTVDLQTSYTTSAESTWYSGTIVENNGSLDNQGEFRSATNTTIDFISDSGTNSFTNDSNFLSGGTGTTVFYAQNGSSLTFNNNGAVEIQSGRLSINCPGVNEGDFFIDPAGNLIFNSNYTFACYSDVEGQGALTFTGGSINFPSGTFNPTGMVNFSGGNITINNTFSPSGLSAISGSAVFNCPIDYTGPVTISGYASFTQTQSLSSLALAGTIDGPGNLILTGNSYFSGAVLTGTGAAIISSQTTPDTSTLSITGNVSLNRTLEIDGSCTWAGGNIQLASGTLNNYGTFAANSAIILDLSASSGANEFLNAGTFINESSGLTQFYPISTSTTLIFDNTGIVDVQAGKLILLATIPQLAGSTLIGGTWIVQNAASLTLANSAPITTLGSGANVTLDGSSSAFPQINTLLLNQGNLTLTNGRKLSTAGSFTNSGTITIGTGATFECTSPLTNTGAIDIAGGTLQLDAGLATSDLLAQLLSGRNGGAWNGPGIDSSYAAADPMGATAVGYLISGSTINLQFTWLGDTNLDGVVNAADLADMAPVGTINATWAQGDFNYDGVVNADDYSLFFLGASLQGVDIVVISLLPEPTQTGLLLVWVPLIFWFRRRGAGRTHVAPS